MVRPVCNVILFSLLLDGGHANMLILFALSFDFTRAAYHSIGEGDRKLGELFSF